ncbi:MAG: tRNA pseudouridine(38-40) synthase TruA, partial [Clostridioides difficile]|nr:tRNA pseudouridine(38-40) synthase TruA [Clostridioides difficile]
MRNIKMIVAYDGSRYKGYQKLGDNNMTIQEKLENVLSKMTNETVEIIGSGRTDMG